MIHGPKTNRESLGRAMEELAGDAERVDVHKPPDVGAAVVQGQSGLVRDMGAAEDGGDKN